MQLIPQCTKLKKVLVVDSIIEVCYHPFPVCSDIGLFNKIGQKMRTFLKTLGRYFEGISRNLRHFKSFWRHMKQFWRHGMSETTLFTRGAHLMIQINLGWHGMPLPFPPRPWRSWIHRHVHLWGLNVTLLLLLILLLWYLLHCRLGLRLCHWGRLC